MTPFESLISELAAATGLPLQIDARESCSLETDGAILTLQHRREFDDVVIYAPVTEPGEPLTPETLRAALSLAFNGQGTRGNFLGLVEDALLLSTSIPMEGLSAEALGGRLLAFVDAALVVRDALESAPAPPAPAAMVADQSESADFMKV